MKGLMSLQKIAMLDGGEMAQKRASSVQQRREEVWAALHCSVSFPCLVVECSDCEALKLQPKEKWIAVDNKERLRNIAPSGVQPRADTVARDAGRNSKKVKMPGKCEGPKWMCM